MEDARGRSEMVKVLRMSQAERSVARRIEDWLEASGRMRVSAADK